MIYILQSKATQPLYTYIFDEEKKYPKISNRSFLSFYG